MKNVEQYAEIIMRDERENFVSERTIRHSEERIEREYEFTDGAVVKYEWQDVARGRAAGKGRFNHRFTLVRPPSPNPKKFTEGVIKVIE